jgi:uncharacterized protein (TIGR02598 family)
VAIGIVSFAVVAIVGMLPIALNTAKDSMLETDAAVIAQRVFAELQAGTGTNRPVSINAHGDTMEVDLSSDGTNFLAFGDACEVRSSPTSEASITDTEVSFLGAVSVSTNTGISHLSRVEVSITSPASAPASSRTTNTFMTLMGY